MPAEPVAHPTSTALLLPGDVAAYLGVPVSWVYAECRAGRMPHVKLGRYTRIRRDALDAWISALEAGSLKGPWRRYAEVLPGSGPGGSPHG
jgi:excisionase family DNA binding protein